jgi:hypothetical protein
MRKSPAGLAFRKKLLQYPKELKRKNIKSYLRIWNKIDYFFVCDREKQKDFKATILFINKI